jgi:hypothetical protein
MCNAFPYIVNIHQFKIPKLHEYFDNQECTTPTQSVRKYCKPALFRDKNFTEDRNGNGPLDRSIGRVTIKICGFSFDSGKCFF